MSIKIFSFILLFVLNLSASERIISLSPSITEILYALNADRELVATSSYSLYPKEAQKLPIIGGYESPHIEKILSHSPTLVVGQTFNQAALDKLKYFKIKTLTLKLKTIDDIKNSISLLGKALNKTTQANKLTTNIQSVIAKIKKSQTPHSVMIVYGLKEDLRSGIYIAGNNIFFDDIITLSHNTNSYTNNTTRQPVLNYENVIALNPDQIIILHSHATEPNVNVNAALKNWYSLPTNAAKNRKISIIDEDYTHIPSHRIALTIQRLSKEMSF